MGVKGLWNFLSPVCEKKSLWELEDQTVAIDLSCWICDSQTISFAVTRPHLRNLFFRTSCLLLSGIQPIFVLEGEAPDIKQQEIRRRIQTVWNRADNGIKRKETRPRFNKIIQQCCKLLEALGVSSVRSPGEGEAMCAHLNAIGLVDGCITQDNDCFLYGANVVYRNFSSAHSSKRGGSTGFSVDVYDMDRVQKFLGLNREGLVALALLCGCDYQTNSADARGVAGIGIETAAHLISDISKISDGILTRLKSWNSNPNFLKLEKEVAEVESGSNCLYCGHRGNLGRHDRVGCKTCGNEKGCQLKRSFPEENSLLNMSLEDRKSIMVELGIRRKALANPSFPCQSIIDEYLSPWTSSDPKPKYSTVSWAQPNLQSFLEFAETYLGWTEEYSLEKFLPLLTRWKVSQGEKGKGSIHPHDIIPVSIKKERVSRGMRSYEIEWKIIPAISQLSHFSTLEPCDKFENMYPLHVEEFQKNKKKTKKGTSKSERRPLRKTISKADCKCSNENRKKKGHLCNFLIDRENSDTCSDVNKEICVIKPEVEIVTKLLENLDVHKDEDGSNCSSEDVPDLDDEIDALELSLIVKSIVSKNSANSVSKHHDNSGSAVEYRCSDKTLSSETNNSELWDFSDDEFVEFDIPLHLRAKCHLNKQSNSSSTFSSDKETESDYSKNIDAVTKTSGDNPFKMVSTLQNYNFKGHLPDLNFSLGITPLLQSPEICKAKKLSDNTPLKAKD